MLFILRSRCAVAALVTGSLTSCAPAFEDTSNDEPLGTSALAVATPTQVTLPARTSNDYILDTEYSSDTRWMLWHDAPRPGSAGANNVWHLRIAKIDDLGNVVNDCSTTFVAASVGCNQGAYDLGAITPTGLDWSTSVNRALQYQGEFGSFNGSPLLTFGRSAGAGVSAPGLYAATYDSVGDTWTVYQLYNRGIGAQDRWFVWPSENAGASELHYHYVANDAVQPPQAQFFLARASLTGPVTTTATTPITNITGPTDFNIQTSPAFPRYVVNQSSLIVLAEWSGIKQARRFDYGGWNGGAVSNSVLPLSFVETLPVTFTPNDWSTTAWGPYNAAEVFYLQAKCDGTSNAPNCYTLYRVNGTEANVVQSFNMNFDAGYTNVFSAEIMRVNNRTYAVFLTQPAPTDAMATAQPSHVWLAALGKHSNTAPDFQGLKRLDADPDGGVTYYSDPEWACNGQCVIMPTIGPSGGKLLRLPTGF